MPNTRFEDERWLIDEWQRGQGHAGELLMRRYRPGIRAFFAKNAPMQADDLTQRTLLKCVEVKGRVRPEFGLASYLYGIARKVLFEHRRRSQLRPSRQPLPPDSLGAVSAEPLVDEELAESLVVSGEITDIVSQLLTDLPACFRSVVELHYWGSLSVAEIAETLGLATGTVKSRLARARGMLHRSIELRRARGELDPRILLKG